MPFNMTNKAAYQHYKSSLLLPLGRKKLTIKEHELPLIVMSAAEVDGVTFSNSASAPVPKFLNPGPAPAILQI